MSKMRYSAPAASAPDACLGNELRGRWRPKTWLLAGHAWRSRSPLPRHGFNIVLWKRHDVDYRAADSSLSRAGRHVGTHLVCHRNMRQLSNANTLGPEACLVIYSSVLQAHATRRIQGTEKSRIPVPMLYGHRMHTMICADRMSAKRCEITVCYTNLAVPAAPFALSSEALGIAELSLSSLLTCEAC